MSDEDLATIAFLEYLKGVESGIISARKLIADRKGVTSHPDYNQAGWTTVKGTKGDYEQVSRKLARVEVFDRLATELKKHGGFWVHGGFKYWVHSGDESVVDRRRV